MAALRLTAGLLSCSTALACASARVPQAAPGTPPPASQAATPATTASTDDHVPKPTPGEARYEEVLTLLRTHDQAIPQKPSVHPLHAVFNREAIIPPMCYTRTEGQHNPCYVCHQDQRPGRPNAMNDGDLQEAYSFSELGTVNHWKNLFEDRAARVAMISDDEILEWVSQDNYSDLAERLRKEGFGGYVPDLVDLPQSAAAFDAEGFARDGSHWVAFNYKPMPSTFWPTNGATDDVMIRLAEPFRTDANGNYVRDVYRANLALVEANIKGLTSIDVGKLDERAVGTDLNDDGQLTTIGRITHVGAYVGGATGYLLLPHAYPLNTEFLHSVRYLGVDESGRVYIPPRMKELRYMRKQATLTGPQLYDAYLKEGYAKEQGDLPGYINREHYGLDNEMGWLVAGFLEGPSGKLRFNTYEENLFCMGCHTSLGSTIDNTFSFARKIDGAAGWGYVNLRGMPDAPNVGEEEGEIATYLQRAGGGGEFRSNPEMEARFFTAGQADLEKIRAAKDVYELVTPSRERALLLNKAYRVIVADQDYIYGRDPSVTPPINVYDAIDNKTSPTLPKKRTFTWDIRLDWSGHVARSSSPTP